MNNQDEAVILRHRQDRIEADTEHEELQVQAGVRVLAITRDGGDYPTATMRFHKMEVLAVLGKPEENEPGTLNPTAQFLFALNHGTAVPPPDTEHIVTGVPYRWVFRHDDSNEPDPEP